MEKEIRISNNLNEIVVLTSFIEELGEELSLPAETATYYLTESYFNRKTTDFPSHR